MKTLRHGLRGAEASSWQLFLLDWDLDVGATDGRFDPLTDTATERFQFLQGLPQDGNVGPNTYGRAMRAPVARHDLHTVIQY
jgi:peptidoglycan hydrolase-like protein with peptidoglycan-binding domain